MRYMQFQKVNSNVRGHRNITTRRYFQDIITFLRRFWFFDTLHIEYISMPVHILIFQGTYAASKNGILLTYGKSIDRHPCLTPMYILLYLRHAAKTYNIKYIQKYFEVIYIN